MTSLRFVGELPVWIGLTLSFVVCVLAWRLYRRESFDLPGRLIWGLPLLRTLAFFLGIMVLTGPVLHHRKTVGEPGQIKIYIDASQSMGMTDSHMSSGRKLLATQQLGWVPASAIDQQLLSVADELSTARQNLLKSLQASELDASRLDSIRKQFVQELKRTQTRMPAKETPGSKYENSDKNDKPEAVPDQSLRDQLTAQVIEPAEKLSFGDDPEAAISQLIDLAQVASSVERSVRDAFEREANGAIQTADESVRSALARFDETSRWRRSTIGLLGDSNKQNEGIFAKLKERHDVEVIAMTGSELTELMDSRKSSELSNQFPEFPTGRLTDLSSGFSSSQKSQSGSAATEDAGDRQTAVVLITDGQHNSGASPLQMARVLGGQGVQFYPVSTGAAQPAPDLALTDVTYPDLVFLKDSVRGTLRVRDVMSAGKPFVVQIAHEEKVLWREQMVTLGKADREIDFNFKIEELVEQVNSRTSADLGIDVKQHTVPLQLTASIIPHDEETETANNERAMRISAITQSHRLLILDGRSRWETRYLRNAFDRDSQWEVNTVIAGSGNDELTLPRGEGDDQFPTTKSGLFDYDLIIFGEISSQLFNEEEFQWIREFVSMRGGGIVFIDGPRKTLRKLNEQNLASLLPVNWLDQPIQIKPTRLQLTDKGATVAALKMADDDKQNRQFWNELPPPHKISRVECLPGAEVLAEVLVDNAATPALVTRNFGGGRVLYLAFDETWRWRYKTADTYHQRIWNQLAQLAMPRPFAASDEFVSVDTGRLSYNIDESVDVRIRLVDTAGKPVTESTVDALIWKEGRHVATASLNADPDVAGIYRGDTGSLSAGEYEVSIRASGFPDGALKAKGKFVVEQPDSGELQHTSANELLLTEMAAASGGVFLREEEIARLPGILEPLSNGFVVESETLLWQSYWWFAAIVILLTIEWVLRKRIGLL